MSYDLMAFVPQAAASADVAVRPSGTGTPGLKVQYHVGAAATSTGTVHHTIHRAATIPPGATARHQKTRYVRQTTVTSAPAHNYILGVDFQGDDIWVATAEGLSHGIRQQGSGATGVPPVQTTNLTKVQAAESHDH